MSLRDNLNVLGKTKKSTKLYVKREISVPIKNESTKIGEDGKESVVNTSYKIKFIDSARFMASALSNFADNFAEGIHKTTCQDCDCFLEYESVKDNLMKYI